MIEKLKNNSPTVAKVCRFKSFNVHVIPILDDNYSYIISDTNNSQCIQMVR